MNRHLKTFLLSLSIVLLIVGCELASEQQNPKSSSLKVDIGGFKLNIQVMGEGYPAVIMDSGSGDTLKSWEKVQPRVAEFTKSVSYDRAGLGQSEPGPEPRSAEQVAKELHTLLKNADIQPPYVLVGHSLGGIHILTYANIFPDEIAGMIFVDTKDGTTFDGWKADLQQEKYEQLFNNFDNFYRNAKGTLKAEWEALKKTIGRPQRMENLPDVPVVVLTSIRLSDEEKKFGLTQEVVKSSLRVHKELSERFPRNTHITTQKSGHYIHIEEPELVVSEIRKIVDMVRSENR